MIKINNNPTDGYEDEIRNTGYLQSGWTTVNFQRVEAISMISYILHMLNNKDNL